jgi:hypothetical protein
MLSAACFEQSTDESIWEFWYTGSTYADITKSVRAGWTRDSDTSPWHCGASSTEGTTAKGI